MIKESNYKEDILIELSCVIVCPTTSEEELQEASSPMYIDSYVHEPRTAGISIFHDGLPKLASVHCYDRGNVATFGLQSCQPKPAKHPPELYPIRPVVNHINPKGSLVNQPRMYTGPPRPHINQSKVYSGAFYPPGNQPRLQFVDGRPILIPSTFENKFIPKQCFDPTVNKSKSVVYNDPHPYPNCCKQYASLDNCHSFPDDVCKRPTNFRPDIPNTMPYTMHVEMMRRRMSKGDYNGARQHHFCDALHGEILHHPTKMATDSLNPGNLSMHCHPGNPHVAYIAGDPTVLCKPGNPPLGCKPGNPHVACKPPVVIDLVGDEEFKEKCSINEKTPENLTHSPNKHNGESRSNMRTNSCESNDYQMKNGALFRCNSCQQELSLENCNTYINASSRTPSQNHFTSSLLCNECDRKNRIWDTIRNVECYNSSHQNENIPREFTRIKSNVSDKRPDVIDLETPCNGANEGGTLHGNFYNANIKRPTNSHVQMPTAHDHLRDHTGIPICIYCNRNLAANQMFSADTHNPCLKMNQSTPACLRCVRSWRRSIQQNIANNVSQNYFNGHKDVVSSDALTKTLIVIDVENLSDDENERNIKTGSEETVSDMNSNIRENHLNEIHPSMSKGELVVKGESNIESNSEERKCNHSNNNLPNRNSTTNTHLSNCELDIDEKSFESFINNPRGETDSPTFDINFLSDHNKNHESQLNELSRKRKSPFPNIPLDNRDVFDHISNGDMKSNPTSPNFHINEEQLQKLRNTITPILKAKKWIRQNSLDTPTDESSGSFNSD